VTGALVMGLHPTSVSVEPGTSSVVMVTIRNTGTVVERFRVELLGEAVSWGTVDVPIVSLLPGEEQKIGVTFTPPRTSSPAAGVVPFAIKVAPQEASDETIVEEGEISVLPFVEPFPVITPRTSTGIRAGRHAIRIHNKGNAPVLVRFAGVDPDDQLDFRFKPLDLTVPPGRTGQTQVRVRTRSMGKTKAGAHQFQVAVNAEGAPTAFADAAMQPRAIAVARIAKIAIVLVGLAIVAGLYRNMSSQAHDVANNTPTTAVVTLNDVHVAGSSATSAPAGGSTSGGGGTTTTAAPTTTTAGPTTTTEKTTTTAAAVVVVPTTTSTTAPTTTTTGSTTTTTGSTLAPVVDNGAEKGLEAWSAAASHCLTYDPASVAVKAPALLVANDPRGAQQTLADFKLDTAAANMAKAVASASSQRCLISDSGPTRLVYWQPRPKSMSTLASTACASPAGGYVRKTAGPAQQVVEKNNPNHSLSFIDSAAADAALVLLSNHGSFCWIGGGADFWAPTFVSTAAVEYWP
jgi:hypothetical protein